MSSARNVFMFPGQGTQYCQMGRGLFDSHASFRRWMLRLDALVLRLGGEPVLERLYAGDKKELFDRTRLTHPAIFMVEYSMAQCLMESGVMPAMTLGASLGAFAAAAVAGYLSLETALSAVLQQARALEDNCEPGGMLAVLASPSLSGEEPLKSHSDLAAVNFGSHFAVAARMPDLRQIEEVLTQRGVTHQRLAVSFAFHSRWIDPARLPFEETVGSMPCSSGRLPLVCCAHAAVMQGLPGGYFWDVVRRPIRFQDTLLELKRQHGPCRYIDVGPSGTLATFVKYALPDLSGSSVHAILTPFGRDQANLAALTGRPVP